MIRTHQVSAPSRIMLPTYPVVSVLLGLAFLLQDPQRTDGPVFDLAKNVIPIAWWGVAFLAVGLLEVTAMVTGWRSLYQQALVVGAGIAAFWFVLIESAAVRSPDVSFTSGLWVLIPIAAHVASARSLAGETTPE